MLRNLPAAITAQQAWLSVEQQPTVAKSTTCQKSFQAHPCPPCLCVNRHLQHGRISYCTAQGLLKSFHYKASIPPLFRLQKLAWNRTEQLNPEAAF